jgi:phage major head subunit gpT-like protein
MDLTRNNLNRLFEDWRIVSLAAFSEGAEPVAERICQIETSNAAVNIYDLMVQFPLFRRFRDQIAKQNLASAQHQIKNDEWESTVEVKQADVERDTYGKYNNLFKMLGTAARRSPDAALASLFVSAFTTNDYTGTTFFGVNKPHLPNVADVGTFTNKMTEKPSAGSWEKAKQILSNITDLNGEPMGIGANRRVICSSKWESTFKRILNAELIMQVSGDAGAAVTNIYKGDAELVVFPYLNTAAREDKWAVLDTTWPLRAFILQKEVQLRLYKQDDPNQHHDAFKNHVFLYQGYYRGDVGFGLPHLAVGSTGADAAL